MPGVWPEAIVDLETKVYLVCAAALLPDLTSLTTSFSAGASVPIPTLPLALIVVKRVLPSAPPQNCIAPV